MHRRFINTVAMLMVMVLSLTGCTSEASNVGRAKDKKTVDTGFTVTSAGSYDSADTAVVISTDQENSAVVFMNMETGKQYTLYYDGTTYVKDKHDGPMTISQIEPGDVVDVTFLKGKKRLASIQRSPQAWVYDEIENYDLGGPNKTANIGSNTYSLPDDVVVLSEGRRSEVMDVVKQDVLTVSGIDHKIYSINVERGHGYLRLKNDQALIGGWIEVGNSVIREITEDMLLVVPEGSYQVLLSHNGASCTKEVTIERNKEVILDVGDLEITENKTGRILFSVTPESAKVSIDGQTVDISKAVELPYGIHQVHLEAKGYDSLTKYIQVGSEYATISFELEEERDDDDRRTVSSNTVDDYQPAEPAEDQNQQDSLSENALGAKSGNRVYIDAPKNVEVYLDGNYIGISPISFKKTIGSHTITLRKNGYETKSYTIYLYNDGEDITYSFTDLVEKTVSGNSTKPNDDGLITVHMKLDMEGVRVFVDNTLKGETDAESESLDFKLEPGKHTITLIKIGYGEKDYEIDIPKDTKEITFTREDFPGFGDTISGNETDPPEEDCEHEYDKEDGKCTKCGEECPHKFSDKEEITVEPTCTTDGKKVLTCEVCGYRKTETVPATGHDYSGEGEVTKEPTCTEPGERTITCSKCQESSKPEEILATGHNYQDGKCTNCQESEPESETGKDEGKDPDNSGNPDEGSGGDENKEDSPGTTGSEETDSDSTDNNPQTPDNSETVTTERIVQNSNSRRKR